MKIVARLHLYPPDHCAGAEMMVHSMLRALVARGHECRVWLSMYSDSRAPYDLDGVKVFPQWYQGDFLDDAATSDVMLTHMENTPFSVSVAQRCNKPLVQVLHNTHPPTRMYVNLKSDLTVFNSEWMRAELGDHPAGIVVRPPIIADDYRTTPGDAVTLVNLTEEKGGKLFWQLAERMPDVPFLAVEGGYGDQITGRLPNVESVAHGTDMRTHVYARTRVVLMPSIYESWGRVAGEAMVSGIPVIAHPTPGLVENIGAGGTFVDRDDVDGWEREIRRLMNPEQWRVASEKAAERSAELDPTGDLDRFCEAVEAL